MNYLELLSPAKNLECGLAAIDHGADAVYIGAERYGARSAAGNSVDDIAKLCDYAHVFGVKVYVTVNTIIYDRELSDTERLISRLYDVGVDAIIVQDMGVLEMDLPPIALHASTQTDNRTPEKVAWLVEHGFKRVVMARELSLTEIEAIHKAVPCLELEAFVHGALCVSYSGLCYASQYCFNRSANRGDCSQFCRLKFNLEDSDKRIIVRNSHLLSLKDMCRIDYLERMAMAGVSSFKIEGRLKGVDYVKNVTDAYSQKLDEMVRKSPDKYCRTSLGRCKYTFVPDLGRSFNRGFTDYFIDGRKGNITSFVTPKAIGKAVGYVKEIYGGSFTVAGSMTFANGDGLCFISNDKLVGFRVNKVEENRLFPLKMPSELRPGMVLYRNYDAAFDKILSRKSAVRKIGVDMILEEASGGFRLSMKIGEIAVSVNIEVGKQVAESSQVDNITRQLSKLGNTPFECLHLSIVPEAFCWFIPSSVLSHARRDVVGLMVKTLSESHRATVHNAVCSSKRLSVSANIYPRRQSYMYNVSNRLARKFYADSGEVDVYPAFELERPEKALIMQCRHCIKYSLGHCVKRGGTCADWHEPLFLRLSDGRRFRLQFACDECEMNIYAEN